MRFRNFLLLLFFVAFITNLYSTTMTSSYESESIAHVKMYLIINFAKLDDKIPMLYTNHFLLALRSAENDSFYGVFFISNRDNTSEVLPVLFGGSYVRGTGKYWINNRTASYDQLWPWHLISTGEDFPLDRFNWYLLVGCNVQISPAYQPQLSNVPPEISSKWNLTPLRFVNFTEHPSDTEMLKIGVQPKAFHQPAYQKLTYWYLIKLSVTRQNSDIVRFTALYLIPAIGLLGVFGVAWGLHIFSFLRKGSFRIGVSNGLTLFLSSALFAFPFILSINQYAPPFQVTRIEELFYFDASLAFGSAIAVLAIECFSKRK